ncbi:hypothetical protein BDDG_12438 [Blastomyces dermatitidis ATCC 18188]|uniref:Uncharacterized protein n=1 Tax=Ajellomyces dermatitidis (strain ATCC 18188 / CBS 674.68) TaxID=653446 RepID=A0A0J9ERX5_AJEDA|nr:hypothetical protein BDDG_12438 [Blastomyces dermatitidis ATCC 18188]
MASGVGQSVTYLQSIDRLDKIRIMNGTEMESHHTLVKLNSFQSMLFLLYPCWLSHYYYRCVTTIVIQTVPINHRDRLPTTPSRRSLDSQQWTHGFFLSVIAIFESLLAAKYFSWGAI